MDINEITSSVEELILRVRSLERKLAELTSRVTALETPKI